MSRTPHTSIVPAADARRLLLGNQGLLADPTRRAGPAAVRALIEALGFVQLDSINVVERAHHLTLASRLDGYRPPMLQKLLEKTRELFEHWTHDASAIPTRWFPYWRPHFERSRARIPGNAWWRSRLGGDPDVVFRATLDRIRAHGPISSRDLDRDHQPDPSKPAESGWWSWKPGKAALEHLWRVGELTVVKRVRFEKVYDLTERVLPAAHASPTPSSEDHVAWASQSALDRLGLATAGELAAFWRLITPAQARAWAQSQIRAGALVEVQVTSADGSAPRRAYAHPDWQRRARALPDAPDRVRLLSPFDPILRDRARALRTFGFDYRFEAFTPEAKRVYGYYVLPILEGDRLVGRVDPKFHRDRGVLELRKVWWEPGIKETRARRRAFEDAAHRLADVIGAESVER